MKKISFQTTIVKLLFSIVILSFLYVVNTSSSTGVTGMSTSGCSCHAANNSATIIGVTGIPATGYVPGTAYTVTLTVTNTSKVAAGFDLTVNIGSLTAGSGMALSGTTQLYQTSSKAMVSGTSTWTFTWTAPATAGGNLVINVAGNAVNGNGQDSGDVPNIASFTFSPNSSTTPIITNVSATNITQTSADINATIDNSGSSTTIAIEYGTTTAYGQSQATVPATVNAITNVIGYLTGLTPGTLYHYRVVATNSTGVSNSQDYTFTTLNAAIPVISTLAATNITSTTATINGLGKDTGTVNGILGFEWGTSTSYGNVIQGTPLNTTLLTPTSFLAALSGLTPNTTYHYRAVMLIGSTPYYGTDLTFTTSAPALPVAYSYSPTNITTTSATFNGAAKDTGNVIGNLTFEYGTTTSYGNVVSGNPNFSVANTLTNFSSAISGLLPNTTYHYRAILTLNNTLYYGSDISFTTLSPTTPLVSTVSANNVSDYSAQLNGFVNAQNYGVCYLNFEWGTSSSYGNIVTASPSSVSGSTLTAVSAVISSLSPLTTYYYRLVGTCGNDVFYGSPLTLFTGAPSAINNVSENKYFNIYPNPCSDILNITSLQNEKINSISVYNIQGQFVKNFTANNIKNNQIEILDLPKGLYFLKIKTERNLYNFKLSKN